MRCIGSVLWLLAMAAPVFAQPPAHPGTARIEVGGAFTWTGGAMLGDAKASLTQPDGSPLPIFNTSSAMAAGSGAEVNLAVRVTRHLQAEATGSWTRPALQTTVSGDLEGAPGATLTQGVSQFSVEAGGLWSFNDFRRLTPFARASAGWMRQLSADNVLYQDGLIVHLGGGAIYWLRDHPGRRFSRFGVRAEIRATRRRGGLELTTVTHTWAPSVSIGATLGF